MDLDDYFYECQQLGIEIEMHQQQIKKLSHERAEKIRILNAHHKLPTRYIAQVLRISAARVHQLIQLAYRLDEEKITVTERNHQNELENSNG